MQKAQVQAAVDQLRAQGERISQNAIIKKLGGSKRDVGPLLKEVLGELGACGVARHQKGT